MNSTEIHTILTAAGLDPAKIASPSLQKAEGGTKLIAQCPACAADGHDTKAEHLVVYQTGQFGCVCHSGPDGGDHRKRIMGIAGSVKPNTKHGGGGRSRLLPSIERFDVYNHQRRSEQQTLRISELAAALPEIERSYEWSEQSFLGSSPFTVSDVSSQGRFLVQLFPQSALVWCGEVSDTGGAHKAHHWQTTTEWFMRDFRMPDSPPKPFTTGSTFKSGTFSRAAEQVAEHHYVIVELDELDGRKPETSEEVELLHARSRAVFRFLRETLGWTLAAVIDTGNKSLHAWFRKPPQCEIELIAQVGKAWGLDTGVLQKPTQPVRLPFYPHQKSGRLSRPLWLERPEVLMPEFYPTASTSTDS